MSKGGGLLKAWHKMLQQNFNVFLRSAPNLHKQRKYEHIQIQKDFEAIENERKLHRLSLIEYQKKLKLKLLQQKLDVMQNNPEFLENLNTNNANTASNITMTSNNLKDNLNEFKEAKKISEFQGYDTFRDYKQALGKEDQQSQRKFIDKEAHQQQQPVKDMSIIDIKNQLEKIQQDLVEIQKTKNEIADVERKIEDLEPDYILLTGFEKKLVLNFIAYYDYHFRNDQGIIMHPETIKSIETVHYHAEHNLPIKRELLYEVVPELFEEELHEKSTLERERILAKRPVIQNDQYATIQTVDVPPEKRRLDKHPFEEIKQQEYEFREFQYNRAIEFSIKHADYIDKKIASGFASMEAVLENLENKPKEKLLDEENAILNDLQEMRKISYDYLDLIQLNKRRIFAKQRELSTPPDFILKNEKLKKAWYDKWEEIVTNSIELNQSLFVPDNSENFQSKLDDILKEQRALDVQELIRLSQENYKAKVGGDEPLPKPNLNEKNPELLKKLNVLSSVMNQLPSDDKKLKRRPKPDHFQSSIHRVELPEERKILIDELTKVLYLNNQDPRKYNIQFWANHFNIDPQKLRNIFNYVSYAIPDQANSRETGKVLRFIYEKNIGGANNNNNTSHESSKLTSEANN